MKVNVSELEGRPLNYAVAVCLWGEPIDGEMFNCSKWQNGDMTYEMVMMWKPIYSILREEFNPSGNWAHGGPLVDKYATLLSSPSNNDEFGYLASVYVKKNGQGLQSGDTYLVAFCRSLVSAIHRKDEIEIPDELVEA